jgi:hypothetical protein
LTASNSMTQTALENRAQSCEKGRAAKTVKAKTLKGGGSNGGPKNHQQIDQQVDQQVASLAGTRQIGAAAASAPCASACR